MLSHDKQTQRTFAQADYISILAETFLTAKKAEGRSTASLYFYREKLNIFMAFCEAQAVTQAQDITARVEIQPIEPVSLTERTCKTFPR